MRQPRLRPEGQVASFVIKKEFDSDQPPYSISSSSRASAVAHSHARLSRMTRHPHSRGLEGARHRSNLPHRARRHRERAHRAHTAERQPQTHTQGARARAPRSLCERHSVLLRVFGLYTATPLVLASHIGPPSREQRAAWVQLANAVTGTAQRRNLLDFCLWPGSR